MGERANTRDALKLTAAALQAVAWGHGVGEKSRVRIDDENRVYTLAEILDIADAALAPNSPTPLSGEG